MQTAQSMRNAKGDWTGLTPDLRGPADLVLVFGAPALMRDGSLHGEIQKRYPGAHIAGASTAGEISGRGVSDDTIVVTAVKFDGTRVKVVSEKVENAQGSFDAATRIAQKLNAPDLAHVLVFADGTNVNGTEVVRGLRNELPRKVATTGGLAGDGPRFEQTYVADDEGIATKRLVCVGLYGERIRAGYGSLGGWDPTGHARTLTKSEGNVLLEIDGRPALEVYKEVLGEHASGLPASGLLHPLLVQTPEADFVRTLVGVDAKRNSLTFAGDVPTGRRAYFMRANFDRLIQGAQGAASDSVAASVHQADLAILVSCVGRKLVLKERTQDEIDAVRKVVGKDAVLTGFYSYGEICPAAPGANCTLHNQTMTVTTLTELESSASAAAQSRAALQE